KPSKPSGFEGFSFTVGKTGDLIPLREAHFNPRSFRAPAEPAPRDMDSSSNLDSSSINAPRLSSFGAQLVKKVPSGFFAKLLSELQNSIL
ncbi:MAG: hypothetical protein KH614_02830, partial [Firmicutes bacterium]|nr:hypothetical protein [Bacillota bacterium]